MGAGYSHTTRAAGLTLTANIYNTDHQNHIDQTPATYDDASTNVAAMQTTTDPGEVGSESLATTLTGELERLRFIINEMKGTAQWYVSEWSTLALGATPSVTGTIRMTNNEGINWRNAADDNNIAGIILNGSDQIQISNASITVTIDDNLGINVTAFGTGGTSVLGIDADGTVPSTSPAGMIQIFADDSSAGATDATIAFRFETDPIVVGTFTPSHKFPLWINGTEYHIQLDAV